MTSELTTAPLRGAGVALGVGMGGFIDGILLHLIFQVHSMLSARISTNDLLGVKVNMVWDGIFHLAVWLITALGVTLLFRAARRTDVRWSTRAFWGALLFGWGLFNFVEGLIDHHLLQLHHVYEAAGLSVWDYAFLGSGVAMLVIGALLMRAATCPTRT